MDHHLAQVNVSLPLEPLDSARLAGFVAELQPLNALADTADGFVWRLQTEDGDATAIRAFADDRIIVNLSVWISIEALGAYAFSGRHRDVLRQRRGWFARLGQPETALWWVPADHRPSVAEAVDRLELLRAIGPSPSAFTFRSPYPPPSHTPAVDEQLPTDDRWNCPA